MNGTAAWFTVNAADAIATVAVRAAFTVSAKLDDAVELLWSVTVTVYVVSGLAAVGVPLIAPVDVLMFRPAGKAGEML